eukprot:TRINITY_DN80843_c0_g1_i1.p1 TRINITY_DN80843_c0_g1~~TRINITY_DN80843_c0_g1_i1.p1  ORF type:complete len:164 (+),score=19.51 TRINITY_DN80843_c0_g1_i1:91-582(+)
MAAAVRIGARLARPMRALHSPSLSSANQEVVSHAVGSSYSWLGLRNPCVGLGAPLSCRTHFKFAKPPSPNLDALRKALTEKLVPVHFFLRNNLTFTNFVWDQHFIGIMCSPKFEGKSHKEINDMVDSICDEVGMKGRVRILCQPPSRWHMMKRRTRKRWDFDR